MLSYTQAGGFRHSASPKVLELVQLSTDHGTQSMEANFTMVTAANGLVLIDSQSVFRFPGNFFGKQTSGVQNII